MSIISVKVQENASHLTAVQSTQKSDCTRKELTEPISREDLKSKLDSAIWEEAVFGAREDVRGSLISSVGYSCVE